MLGTTEEAAAYIQELASELSRVAAEHEMKAIEFLLAQVVLEAANIINKSPPGGGVSRLDLKRR